MIHSPKMNASPTFENPSEFESKSVSKNVSNQCSRGGEKRKPEGTGGRCGKDERKQGGRKEIDGDS